MKEKKLKREHLVSLLFITISVLIGISVYSLGVSILRDIASQNAAEKNVEITQDISRGMNTYFALLKGARGLFSGSTDVSRVEWNDYVKSVDLVTDYPGISSLTFIEKVESKVEFTSLLNDIQKDTSLVTEGYPYVQTEDILFQDVAYVINFVEPATNGRERAIGRISSNTSVLAIEKSLNTELLSATPFFTSITTKDPIFIVYLPVRNSESDEFIGVIAESFRTTDLFTEFLDEISLELDGARIIVEDITDSNANTSIIELEFNNPVIATSAVNQINVADRSWEVTLEVGKFYGISNINFIVLYISAIGSGLIFLILSFAYYLLVVQKESAKQYAALSDEKFEAIFKNSVQFTGYLDKSGRIIDLNDTAAKLLGDSKNKLIGKYIWESNKWNSVSAEKIQRGIRRSALGDVVTFEVYVEESDNRIYLDFSLKPIINENGDVLSIVSEGNDISVIKAAENRIKVQKQDLQKLNTVLIKSLEEKNISNKKVTEEKDKLETILKGIGDGVFVLDKERRIILINDATKDITGFSEEELINSIYSDVLIIEEEETGNKVTQFIDQVYKTGLIHNLDKGSVLVKKDGTKVPIADSAAPLKDTTGNVIGCIVVFRDATEERALDKSKSEFVSLASHQLRTPLTGIKWFIDVLKDTELNQEQREFLEEISSSTDRMVDLINDLLAVSHIDNNTERKEQEKVVIPLLDIFNTVRKECTNIIQEKSINIETHIDESLKVNANYLQMHEVFKNLLDNAVKYSFENGKVDVYATSDDYGNGYIHFKDRGIGIPEEDKEKLLTKFFRASNSQLHDAEGNGLGLYIVKSILDENGGELIFENNKEEEGTTFIVKIPLVK